MYEHEALLCCAALRDVHASASCPSVQRGVRFGAESYTTQPLAAVCSGNQELSPNVDAKHGGDGVKLEIVQVVRCTHQQIGFHSEPFSHVEG